MAKEKGKKSFIRKARQKTFTDEQLKRFNMESVKRFNKILEKATPETIKFENMKAPEGFWILPCEDCSHFGECNYYKNCIDDVNMGRALGHFEEINGKII